MKSLKPLLLVGSLLLSSMVWAEGGGDRTFERMQQMRDKAEAVLIADSTSVAWLNSPGAS